jgi:hypothetical protein
MADGILRGLMRGFILFFAACLLTTGARAASFTAALDRDSITLGEQATLSLKFDGVQPQDAPNIPDVAGLQFQYIGPSSAFSFVNGQTTSSTTYNYVVTAQHPGEFTIPAMRANVVGQQFASLPLKLIVSRVNAPSAAAVNSGGEVAFMKLVFPKNKIYVGEPAVGRLELYLRDDVQNFGNFQFTTSTADGFSAGKIVELQNQRRRVQVGNRVYTVIPLAIPLTAVKTGTLALGPFAANCVVALPLSNRGGDPFFNQFFNRSEQKQVALATETVNVESLPLPQDGKPANFTGAVGHFEMTATAGPTNLTAGDPITVRVQISGHGAFDSLTLSAQDAWKNFKTYPPTAKLDTSDQFGFEGTKTFEQIISPQNSDIHELPPLAFSYFNPNDGQYHKLASLPVPLIVKAAGATPLPQIAATKNSAEEKSTTDLLPVKNDLGTLAKNSMPLISQPAFLAMQTLPVFAFLGVFIWRRRTDYLANNPRLRRQRAVAQLVGIGLNDLKKFAAENKPEEFFALIFRLLQEQLGERLDCPATAITENVIEENSILRGAAENLRNDLRELFQLCNQARYAPVRGTAELNSVVAQIEKTVGELQNVKT